MCKVPCTSGCFARVTWIGEFARLLTHTSGRASTSSSIIVSKIFCCTVVLVFHAFSSSRFLPLHCPPAPPPLPNKLTGCLRHNTGTYDGGLALGLLLQASLTFGWSREEQIGRCGRGAAVNKHPSPARKIETCSIAPCWPSVTPWPPSVLSYTVVGGPLLHSCLAHSAAQREERNGTVSLGRCVVCGCGGVPVHSRDGETARSPG